MNAKEARRKTNQAIDDIAKLEAEQETERQRQSEIVSKARIAQLVQTSVPQIQESIERATQRGLGYASHSFDIALEQEELEALAQVFKLDGYEVTSCEHGLWIQVSW